MSYTHALFWLRLRLFKSNQYSDSFCDHLFINEAKALIVAENETNPNKNIVHNYRNVKCLYRFK